MRVRSTRGLAVNPPEIPPPGPRLAFGPWCRLVADEVRRRVPTMTARAIDGRTIELSAGERTATIVDERETRRVSFAGGHMASLMVDGERGDAFTARNVAKSIAGFFDAEQSRPD